ncbi:hypothetical protein [Lichenicoccus roseus]|uniref:hypothetical protein n=1 Tax=Lichenicoccus roseus TaxID=2683649 RepID=UPI001980137A|nr:hypothetical protein [Lichenicoccus roseus]
MSEPPALQIVDGEIIVYRLFDFAYEADLVRAEEIWRLHTGATSARKTLRATSPKAISYDVPPLVLPLEPVRLALADGEVTATATARLYDFGVLTIAFSVTAGGCNWEGFTARLNAVDDAIGPGSPHAVWSRLNAELHEVLGPALTRPARSILQEDYLVGVVRAFDIPITAAALLERCDLVPLLSGEQRTLSDGARADLLRKRFSYYTDDLAVLTWDRAFIYEPRGDSDVLDVIEVANAQLLEMRYYDELLDDELPSMYDLVEKTHRIGGLLSSRRFASLARRLYTLVAEVTELTEKVDNALQVTEDVYLARIYTAALDLFRVSTVSAAVDRKLAIIRDTYAALYEEASSGRAAAMEFIIVILILAEVLLALLRH